MKELSIYVLLFLIAACSNGQDTNFSNLNEFYFNSDKLPLKSDTTASTNNYFVSRISDSEKVTVRFNNIPSNIIKMEDEFGDEFTYVDSVSIFEFNYIDTVQNIEDLKIKYVVDGEEIDTVSFRYEILSEKKRISSKGLNKVLISDFLELLKKDLVKDKNVAVIVYGFSFYRGEKLYSIGGGKLCMIIENE